MRRLPLRARGGAIRAYALVDDEDFAALNVHRWFLNLSGYAYRTTGSRGQQRLVLLHRKILGLSTGDGLEVDHVNRNRLDCRRKNLRVGPRHMNAQNRVAYRGSTSPYRGVSWESRKGCWRATVRHNGRHVHVGLFKDELEAAYAAQRARGKVLPYAFPDPAIAAAELRDAGG